MNEKEIRIKKIICDIIIVLVAVLWVTTAFLLNLPGLALAAIVMVGGIFIGTSLIDLYRLQKQKTSRKETPDLFAANQLILLDEENRPVKNWDLTGKKSMMIGRKDRAEDADVDVDLNNCEFSSFIDKQHAVLYNCFDAWYLVDLNSGNGVKVEKAENGQCDQVPQNCPIKMMPGDVIYIAFTKLMLT